jgi:hypothetical protein
LISSGNLQVSVTKAVAVSFEFTARREIIVEKVSEENAAIEFVEISFKDQYIGRSDMWRLKLSLCNTCAYIGKSLFFSCIRVPSFNLLY